MAVYGHRTKIVLSSSDKIFCKEVHGIVMTISKLWNRERRIIDKDCLAIRTFRLSYFIGEANAGAERPLSATNT
jgi:hypothetical protein